MKPKIKWKGDTTPCAPNATKCSTSMLEEFRDKQSMRGCAFLTLFISIFSFWWPWKFDSSIIFQGATL